MPNPGYNSGGVGVQPVLPTEPDPWLWKEGTQYSNPGYNSPGFGTGLQPISSQPTSAYDYFSSGRAATPEEMSNFVDRYNYRVI